MLQPMGLPENVRVIAWGLSLERPTMIKYSIPSIRGILCKIGGRLAKIELIEFKDIFGPLIDLNFIKYNPIAFIDSKEVEESHAAPPHAPVK